jgi:RNA polymerase sigma-70 factor (ECF subfamily)
VTYQDVDLIRMALDGQSEAFSVLMDRHLVPVRKKLRVMVPKPADLDDLVQEVLIRTWRSLGTFRSECSLRTWMIRIGINEARQSFRRRQRRPVCQALDDFSRKASAEASPQQVLLGAETRQAVRAAVAKLPSMYRDVLLLHDLTELCGRETAERLETTVEAVKSRLFRGRRMLFRNLRNSESRWERSRRDLANPPNVRRVYQQAAER